MDHILFTNSIHIPFPDMFRDFIKFHIQTYVGPVNKNCGQYQFWRIQVDEALLFRCGTFLIGVLQCLCSLQQYIYRIGLYLFEHDMFMVLVYANIYPETGTCVYNPHV